jgi:hypothetical protein
MAPAPLKSRIERRTFGQAGATPGQAPEGANPDHRHTGKRYAGIHPIQR